jgi:hypothetical protein
MSVPAYAIDDETAIKVVDDSVEVVSEGHWKLFARTPRGLDEGGLAFAPPRRVRVTGRQPRPQDWPSAMCLSRACH